MCENCSLIFCDFRKKLTDKSFRLKFIVGYRKKKENCRKSDKTIAVATTIVVSGLETS